MCVCVKHFMLVSVSVVKWAFATHGEYGEGQNTTYDGQFSSTVWDLGMELKSPGLVATGLLPKPSCPFSDIFKFF